VPELIVFQALECDDSCGSKSDFIVRNVTSSFGIAASANNLAVAPTPDIHTSAGLNNLHHQFYVFKFLQVLLKLVLFLILFQS